MVINTEKKQIEIFAGENMTSLVIMNANQHEGSEVWQECLTIGCKSMVLACVEEIDWEHDLSPWNAPAVFRGGSSFTGGASEYLKVLEQKLIPKILEVLPKKPEQMILAGYSLAGLFAIYSTLHTNLFDGVVSASGSLWFPGFIEELKTHGISQNLKKAYLSVGDKEAKTRNPSMKTVEENTKSVVAYLSGLGIKTQFECNEGGHFQDISKRLAKGIYWATMQIE